MPERRCILSNLEKFTSFLAGKWWRHLAYFKARIQLQAKFQVPLEKSTFPSAGLNPGPSDYEAAVLLTELHCQTEN